MFWSLFWLGALMAFQVATPTSTLAAQAFARMRSPVCHCLSLYCFCEDRT